jgi:hypothetical protein
MLDVKELMMHLKTYCSRNTPISKHERGTIYVANTYSNVQTLFFSSYKQEDAYG